MFRVRFAGVGTRCYPPNAHGSHQALHTLSIDGLLEFPLQVNAHAPAAIKGVAQVFLVYHAHQLEISRARPCRTLAGLIPAGPADAQEFTLALEAQPIMLGIDLSDLVPIGADQIFFSTTPIPF